MLEKIKNILKMFSCIKNAILNIRGKFKVYLSIPNSKYDNNI